MTLKRIIGTTVDSPNALDSLPSADLFAYTAGAAAVVVKKEEDGQFTQRFYRARPTAVPTNFGAGPSGSGPSTPSAGDGRNRSVLTLREIGRSNSATVHSDGNESSSSKTWASRERIKAATCVSISRDEKFLAVGEVYAIVHPMIVC
jgi:hypothetical protein